VIKVLPTHEETLRGTARAELRAADLLCLNNPAAPLVPLEVCCSLVTLLIIGKDGSCLHLRLARALQPVHGRLCMAACALQHSCSVQRSYLMVQRVYLCVDVLAPVYIMNTWGNRGGGGGLHVCDTRGRTHTHTHTHYPHTTNPANVVNRWCSWTW
jgi:hypothetical protein